MSDQPTINGLEVYVRGNVSQNTKGWNKDHTVHIKGQVMLTVDGYTDHIGFLVKTDQATVLLSELLDALHQEADAANQREINRQHEQQLAAVRAE